MVPGRGQFRAAQIQRCASPPHPDETDIALAKQAYPVTLVKTLYHPGQLLSDHDREDDGYSYRYAVINMAGQDRGSLLDDFRAVRGWLDFAFD